MLLLYILAPIVLIVGSIMIEDRCHSLGIFGSDLSFVGWILILIGCAILLYGYNREFMTPKPMQVKIAESSVGDYQSVNASDVQWIGEVEDEEE